VELLTDHLRTAPPAWDPLRPEELTPRREPCRSPNR
jgi:hypothetical protein